ncbi:MAG TPA: hypothetical protein VMZ27_18180 [Candidatus Saccharimonadales bacterium]|nr:hypothetical protein [Candidatus Saccharimonadales bacterium]
MEQIKVLHAYWMTCQVPEVEATGKQLKTDSEGKLGDRFNDDTPTPEQKSEVPSSPETARIR